MASTRPSPSWRDQNPSRDGVDMEGGGTGESRGRQVEILEFWSQKVSILDLLGARRKGRSRRQMAKKGWSRGVDRNTFGFFVYF